MNVYKVLFIIININIIKGGYLQKGDTLICDNAAIHSGLETFDILIMLLELNDIDLKYLPCYSPEFNPCELVFAQSKRFLREHRKRQFPLILDISLSFAIISNENMIKYFNKCCR